MGGENERSVDNDGGGKREEGGAMMAMGKDEGKGGDKVWEG